MVPCGRGQALVRFTMSSNFGSRCIPDDGARPVEMSAAVRTFLHLETTNMNWQQIQGKWQEYKGRAKQRWGNLTDNDLTVIDGKRDVLAGKLLTSFGNSKERVEKEIAAWEAACDACDAPKPAAACGTPAAVPAAAPKAAAAVPVAGAKPAAAKAADSI